MWRARVELMWSIIAARVVDLPEPVVPVRRMIPRGSSARVRITSGRPRSSIVRTWYGIARQAMETWPRWRKALTRKRETPSSSYAKSASPTSANSASMDLSSRMCSRALSVSSPVRGGAPSIGARAPWTRAIGGESTLTCRSEPSRSTTWRSAASMSKAITTVIGSPAGVL